MIKVLYKSQYEVKFYTKMSTSNLCQHWDVPYLLKRGMAWNNLKPAETTWNHPVTSQNYLKLLKEIPAILYLIPLTVLCFTKNELFFSCVALMLCIKVIFGQI